MKNLMGYKFLFLFFCGISFLKGICQTDSSWLKKPEVSFSGYADVFYAYDLNKPQTIYRQKFLYNHNRHNEFNLNLGFLKISAGHSKYRANVALQSGTYPTDNYASEQALLQHVFEGNAGLSLNRKNNLWIDAGIFSSHIGFESAISKDNWNLTRSLLAENSPYYLSGVKLSHQPSANWDFALLLCNGWQHIQRIPGNSLPGFCSQVKYIRGDKFVFNWSTFTGSEFPDSLRRMRYFNNLYAQYQVTGKLGLIGGFDFGLQQVSKSGSLYDFWYSDVLIIRYSFSENWKIAVRGEYYQDKKGIIVQSPDPAGFKTTGVSLNLDYSPVKNIALRTEGRLLTSEDKIFLKESNLVKNDFFLVGSMAVSF